MVLIEENTVSDLIDELGSDATLRQFSGDTYNTRGDIIEGTSTDTAIKTLVDFKGGDRKYEREGPYNPNEKSFFVKGTLSISEGDVIIHNSIQYTIKNIISAELENFVHVHELIAEKIN